MRILPLALLVAAVMALSACDVMTALLSGGAPQHQVTGIAGTAPAAAPAGQENAANDAVSFGLPVDRLVIDGETVDVHWPDGDSLNIESGRYRGRGARVSGYNTLESYGAVQRWGDWSYDGLAEASAPSKDLARSQAWQCRTTGEDGAYDRILLECDALTLEMVRQGMAHLFTIDRRLPNEALAAQREAIAARRGIWAQGVPDAVVTSVNSTTDGYDRTFDRYVDTETGQAERAFHENAYSPCQDVCHYGSCMRYLPHDRRFGRDQLTCR